MIRGLLAACVSVLLTGGAGVLAFQPPAPQTEFKPIAEVPPTEQLPGGAFVVVAYAFIWVVTMLYVWSIWRRLRKVEDEMRALRRAGAQEPDRR